MSDDASGGKCPQKKNAYGAIQILSLPIAILTSSPNKSSQSDFTLPGDGLDP
jgi:hypothetical protein